MPKLAKVSAWQTEDGKVFTTKEEAERHGLWLGLGEFFTKLPSLQGSTLVEPLVTDLVENGNLAKLRKLLKDEEVAAVSSFQDGMYKELGQ